MDTLPSSLPLLAGRPLSNRITNQVTKVFVGCKMRLLLKKKNSLTSMSTLHKSKQLHSRLPLQSHPSWLSWSFADWLWCQQCHLSHICLCATMSKCVCVRWHKRALLTPDVHPGGPAAPSRGQVGRKRQPKRSTEPVAVHDEGSQSWGSVLTGSNFFLRLCKKKLKMSLNTNREDD